MNPKLVKKTKVNGSQGPALSLLLSLESFRPLKHAEKNVTKAQVAVLDGNGGADTLEYNEGQGQRPVFEQLSSFFSTIVPIELDQVLEPGDNVEFEPSGMWTTQKDGQIYINMRGNVRLNSTQVARSLTRSKHLEVQTEAKPKQTIQVNNKQQVQVQEPDKLNF